MERMAVGCTAMPLEKRTPCKELLNHDVNELMLLLNSNLVWIIIDVSINDSQYVVELGVL
jgi:hypothetical protein